MSYLSPRIFVLPLIALAVIFLLPRQQDQVAQADAGTPAVHKAVTCDSLMASSAACRLATSDKVMVR
jgi:hypothetical protein